MAATVSITVPASSNRKITVSTGLFINNEFVPSVDSQEFITCVAFFFSSFLSRVFGIGGSRMSEYRSDSLSLEWLTQRRRRLLLKSLQVCLFYFMYPLY